LSKRFPLLITALFRIGVTFSFGLILQLKMREIGAGIFFISFLSTIRGAIESISAPIWGSVSDRQKSRKPLFSFAILITALFYPLYSLANSILSIYIIGALIAFFTSAYQPISMAISSEYSDNSVRKTSKEFSLLNAANSTGMLLGRIVLAFLFVKYPSNPIILIFSILAWIPFCSSLFIKEKIKIVENKTHKSLIKRLFPLIETPHVLKKNGLWSIYAGSFLRQLGITGGLSTILIYLTEVLGLSTSMATIITAINPAFQIISHLFSVKLISRFGPKNSTAMGILFSAVTPFMMACANSWVQPVIGYVFLGLAFGSFFNGASTFISLNTPADRRGEFMAFLSSSRMIGGMVGPLLSGLIASQSFLLMFIIMSTFMVMGGILIIVFAKPVTHSK